VKTEAADDNRVARSARSVGRNARDLVVHTYSGRFAASSPDSFAAVNDRRGFEYSLLESGRGWRGHEDRFAGDCGAPG